VNQRTRTGRAAEDRARRHLEAHGLRLRSANYRCRWGELDLVMENADGLIVFVEVRYRARADYGGALASVDAAKRRRLLRAAQTWLSVHGRWTSASRFDVVALDAGDHLEWVTGAFDAG
jgi:putative endonuclease